MDFDLVFLLDLKMESFLEQDLILKMELEERKPRLSV